MSHRDENGNAAFAGYRLLEPMGSDRFFELFRAEASDGLMRKRRCLIKRIRPGWAQSPDFVFMLQGELRMTRMLQHPNIVPLHDAGRIDGALCLETAELEGMSLAMVLDAVAHASGHLPMHVAAFIAHEVTSALAYAHDTLDDDGQPLNVVHHNVNPENIWLLDSGEVKVVDFGLTKVLNHFRPTLTGGSLRNRVSYISPEQAVGLRLDGRSDLYSLGVVFWEMLAGRPLFRADSPFEAANLMISTRVPRPSLERGQPCKALDAVVMRALQCPIDRRYKSAGAMGSDIARFLFTSSDPRRALRVLLRDLAAVARDRRPIRPRLDQQLVITARA